MEEIRGGKDIIVLGVGGAGGRVTVEKKSLVGTWKGQLDVYTQ